MSVRGPLRFNIILSLDYDGHSRLQRDVLLMMSFCMLEDFMFES